MGVGRGVKGSCCRPLRFVASWRFLSPRLLFLLQKSVLLKHAANYGLVILTLDDKLAEYERSLAERISAASSEPVASALTAMRDHTIAAAARLRGGAVSRACAVRTATAAAAAMVRLPASAADPATETRALLAEARRQLDPCQAQIADGSWDAVRTVVKTAPLASVPKLVTRYIAEQGAAAAEGGSSAGSVAP